MRRALSSLLTLAMFLCIALPALASDDYPTEAFLGDRWHVWFVYNPKAKDKTKSIAFLGLQDNMRPRYNKAKRVFGVEESQGEQVTIHDISGGAIDLGVNGAKEIFPSPFDWIHATVVIQDGYSLTVRAQPDSSCTLEFQPEVLGGGVTVTVDGVTGTLYYADFGSNFVRSAGDCQRWMQYIPDLE